MSEVIIEKTRNADGTITWQAKIIDKRGRIIKVTNEREDKAAAEQDAVVLAYLVTKDAKK